MVFSKAESVGEDRPARAMFARPRLAGVPSVILCTIFHVLHIKKILKCVTDHTAVLIQISESRQFCLRLQLPLRMLASQQRPRKTAMTRK